MLLFYLRNSDSIHKTSYDISNNILEEIIVSDESIYFHRKIFVQGFVNIIQDYY
jgi:hypothetical protein